jgi:tetratricopeptide (TPR) repeat protein/class 3 adenylate cyclase
VVGQVISHYRVVEKIGAGGMGEVYRAHDEELDRDVAIKTLAPFLLTDESSRARFRKEALALAKLNHPNIETVFEFGSEEDIDFLVTEYIPGNTLDVAISSGPLDEKEVLRLGIQLAEGVAAAHDRGIIHRDLKPSNLRLTPEGRLKLLDFGLARLLQSDGKLSQSHEVRGTLPYMAPEQLRGEKADARSDVWAIGAVLYEMATGCRPFPQTQSGELMVAILRLPPPPPRTLNPAISPGLEGVILQALVKETSERYQSADALRSDLESLSAGKAALRNTAFTGTTATSARSMTSKLEVADVLFMDIVAYSRLPMDEQRVVLARLQEAVRGTSAFTQAEADNQLIRIPTGDGMALVFFGDAEAPARCAIELTKALTAHPDIKLRMGIHSGPVYRVADINASMNVAGGGINMAQRVMDCGDAGHILVSKSVADVLGQISEWSGILHELGEAEVKHGVKVHLYNLYTQDVGNSELPLKLRTAQKIAQTVLVKKKRKRISIGFVAAVIAAAVALGWFEYSHRANVLTEKDTIVVADFDNKTGDAVFDDTLKQGLSVALSQSPFLNLLQDGRVNETLKLMGRPPGQRLTAEVAREVCIRTSSKALLAGTISPLGSQYVVGIKAMNCLSGDALAEEQVQAAAKEQVLKVLDTAATSLRSQLGESLRTVRQYDTPLEQATTASLEALRAYSEGVKTAMQNDAAGIPLFKRAVELDPNFASAYLGLGASYANLSETRIANENIEKAYELRDRVSERERLRITADYHSFVTKDLEKANRAYEETIRAYPREFRAYLDLAFNNSLIGQYDKALAQSTEAVRLNPDSGQAYGNLMSFYLFLNRLSEAKTTYDQALGRKLENSYLHVNRYQVAFLEGDTAEMQRQAEAMGKTGSEDMPFGFQSDTEYYFGHREKARNLSRQAVEVAKRNDQEETAFQWSLESTLREAEVGNKGQALREAIEAEPRATSRDVQILAALTLARSGDVRRALIICDTLNKRSPMDSLLNGYWLPTIRAAIELNRQQAGKALDLLQSASSYELGSPPPLSATLYPVYVRGEAYLVAHQGQKAADEFQKIIDHRSMVQNFTLGALAHLQLGRAKMMIGDKDGARKGYQDFLTLWKDADDDIPALKEAKAEYAKLQSQ